MRILYLGLPLGALSLEARGHAPAVVCLGHPRAPGARRIRRRLGRGALVLGRPDLDDEGVQALLASTRPEALLSFFWPRRIPAAVLGMAPRGAYGTHPSLLPRWRGPDPYFWTLRSGDERTGVTLHRLAEAYDTGDVVRAVAIDVDPADDAWSLARRLDRPALELLGWCADRLAAGETLEGAPQDERGATLAPAPTDAQLAIDWRAPAEDVVRLVRAAAPRPGATAQLGDELVEVLRARVCPEAPPRALAPAEAWRAAEGVAVRAGDGAGVLIEATRPAGAAERLLASRPDSAE